LTKFLGETGRTEQTGKGVQLHADAPPRTARPLPAIKKLSLVPDSIAVSLRTVAKIVAETGDARTMKPIKVLLVEDNAGDIRLTQEALKEGGLTIDLDVARDGMEAMSYLRRQGSYSEMPAPDLILLDLNLPKKDGREVLQEAKADPELRRIPIVVLTTSEAESDVAVTYGLHANCYIKKPVDVDQFIKIVKLLEEFWFTIVKLPSYEMAL
jgi:CheY-like chemotaxis protein